MPPHESESTQNKKPKRQVLLTAYLIFSLLCHISSIVIYLVAGDVVKYALPNAGSWVMPVLSLIAGVNIVCLVGLFKWKKWGFWGTLICAFITALVNFTVGVEPSQLLKGAIGIVILYSLLHIGKDKKAWPHLK